MNWRRYFTVVAPVCVGIYVLGTLAHIPYAVIIVACFVAGFTLGGNR